MSDTSTRSVNESAYDLFDRWMAHRQQENAAVAGDPTEIASEAPALPVDRQVDEDSETDEVTEAIAADKTDETDEVIETDEDFEEFAHPAPALGGVAAAPPSLGPEPMGEAEPLLAAAPSPVTAGASVPHPPEPAPAVSAPAAPAPAPAAPGLVLFSPRRGFRHVLTGVAALLTAGAGISGYLARETPTPTTIGVTAGLVGLVLLAWKLRARTTGTQVSIEHGVLRILQGSSRHQFPLVGAHPSIDVLGEPGQRGWRVLIQRRGMSPFVITRAMVDPADFTDALRQFRPQA